MKWALTNAARVLAGTVSNADLLLPPGWSRRWWPRETEAAASARRQKGNKIRRMVEAAYLALSSELGARRVRHEDVAIKVWRDNAGHDVSERTVRRILKSRRAREDIQ